jgi:Tol biopolymer transport system component
MTTGIVRGLNVRLMHAVIVLCAVAAVCFPTAATSTLGAEGKLVFTSSDVMAPSPVNQDGLSVMNADGSGRRQIPHSASDRQPRWSPDGTWIAYVDIGHEPNLVEVMHDDGSGRRALGSGNKLGGALEAPSPWSPDGARLAWGGCGGLCIAQITQSTRRSVSLGGENDSGFSWSPDGRALAAIDSKGELVAVPADGGANRVLATTSDARQPAWSPDGSTVAFVSIENRDYQLAVVPAAGGPVRILAVNAERPRWSTDSRSLLYTLHSIVHRIDVATGEDTVEVANGTLQALSPDGSEIAYTRNRWGFGSNDNDVWIASTDGTGAREVTTAFPTGLSYDDADWTAGSLPPTPQPPPPLSLSAAAEKQTEWVDALAAAPRGDVAYEDASVTCDVNALTSGSVFKLWIPPAAHVTTTPTPCGNYGRLGPFAVMGSLVGWTADVQLTIYDSRDFAAVARVGSAGRELARWTADSYDNHIGRVSDIGDIVGDGSEIVFETWGTKLRGKTFLHVHRRLWHIVDGVPPRVRGSRLPADATDAVAADAGRIVVLAKHDLLMLATSRPVLRRFRNARPDSARLGGDLLGSTSGHLLTVYSVGSGRVLYRAQLSHASGQPVLLSIRSGYAVYRSGIEIHLVRLRDGVDSVLNLPGQAGPVDALLTSRGLFVGYNRAYDSQPGRVVFITWHSLP